MTTETNATQPGATGEPTTDDVVKPPSARELAMEAIAVHREEEETAPINQVDSQLEVDDLPNRKVKIKIDGAESEVTVEELTRQYQKNGAAERRLEEATRLLNEARATVPPLEIAHAAPIADIQTAPKGDRREQGKQFLSAMFDGDEEKALDALEELGIGRPAPTLDATQLAAQLTPAIKQQLVVDSALEKFETDYADVMADPYLEGLAAGFIEQEMKGGKSFVDALEEGGKRTRDWLASKGVVASQPNPTIDRNTKLERKAGMDKIPALNSKATTVEEPEQSASDVIKAMRESRGLTV